MSDAASQAVPSQRVAYITGCDDRFSLLAQALLGSFHEHCPAERLWVCDFGLSESLQGEFRAQDVLLERPPTLPAGAHPWVYKSHLEVFADRLLAEWLVWLDSDCLVTGPLSEAVAGVIEAAPPGRDVAAMCQGRVGSTFEIVQELSGSRELMTRYRIPGSTPYYNSGVFIVRSSGLLAAWSREIGGVAHEGMFEQDLFNVLLQRERIRVVVLDRDVWNVTHQALDACVVGDHGVSCNGKPVLVVHATGSYREVTVDGAGRRGYFRALNHPQLWTLQQQALSRWR
jgi:hypothetical protein